MPDTVFQVLTKRAMTLKRFVSERYRQVISAHNWLGVSVEDNRVRCRVDGLPRLKGTAGRTILIEVEHRAVRNLPTI